MRCCCSYLVLVFVFPFFLGSDALIVPDELPTILSLIYSNIPTLKKGTDSRIGWGFRFGDRADFQVLLELGPQKETAPLANQPTNGNNKRHSDHSFSDQLYAQQQQNIKKNTLSETTGGKFLNEWSNKQSGTKDVETNSFKVGVGEIDTQDVIATETIPSAVSNMLDMLYKEQSARKERGE